MKKFTFILALLLAAVSCEIPFELKKGGEACLHVQCFPVMDGGAAVKVSYAAPAFGPADAYPADFQPSSVRMTVNGTEVELEESAGYYRTYRNFSEGDEIRLEVSAEGVPPISGTTIVPPRPHIASVSCQVVHPQSIDFGGGVADSDNQDGGDEAEDGDDGSRNDVLRVTVELSPTPSGNEFYGIQIERVTTVQISESQTVEYRFVVSPGQFADLSDLAGIDLDNYVSVGFRNGVMNASFMNPMTLLSVRQFNEGKYSFYLNSMDAGHYEISVYRLSEPFYYYAKALYASNFDILSNMGMIPANFTYGNIAGGLGAIGAASTDMVVLAPSESGQF